MSLIPKVFHAVWLGTRPAPMALLNTWLEKNPGWKLVMHTDDTRGWKNQRKLDQLRAQPCGAHLAYSAASDLMRFEILAEQGGVWIDADMEAVAPIPDAWLTSECFASWENEAAVPGWIASCVLGARPGSALFRDIVTAAASADMTKNPAHELGPGIVTRNAARHPELDVHPGRTFCPVYYSGAKAPGDAPIIAIHHWGGTVGLRRDAEGRWLDHGAVETAPAREPVTGRRPTVSVVIPCLGQGQYLPEAVASVVAQTVDDWQIVIAAGDDRSSAVANALAKSNPKIRVIHGVAKGLGDARNQAIEVARGRYILTFDADDILEPTFMAKALKAVEGHRYGIASSLVQEFGGSQGVWNCAPWEGLLEQNALPATALFPRELWEAVQGYDVTVGYEDWDFWLRCSRLPVHVTQIPEYLFRYRVHGASMMRWNARNGSDEFWRAMLRLRHPSLYAADRLERDRQLLGRMGPALVDKLQARSAQHPGNHALRALLAIAATSRAAIKPEPSPTTNQNRGRWFDGRHES